MNSTIFYLLTGSILIVGTVLMSKETAWPSEAERKNRLLRAVRSGIGATLAGTGLVLIIMYQTAGETFFHDLSLLSVLVSFLFLVVPTFFLLTIGLYVQYGILEKLGPMWTQRLRDLTRPHEDQDKN